MEAQMRKQEAKRKDTGVGGGHSSEEASNDRGAKGCQINKNVKGKP